MPQGFVAGARSPVHGPQITGVLPIPGYQRAPKRTGFGRSASCRPGRSAAWPLPAQPAWRRLPAEAPEAWPRQGAAEAVPAWPQAAEAAPGAAVRPHWAAVKAAGPRRGAAGAMAGGRPRGAAMAGLKADALLRAAGLAAGEDRSRGVRTHWAVSKGAAWPRAAASGAGPARWPEPWSVRSRSPAAAASGADQ